MRKLLLFIIVGAVITVTSCSKEEGILEVSQEEKVLLVEQVLVEFNKSAVKTGKLDKFLKEFKNKERSSDFNRDEIRYFVNDFLGDQTDAFLNLLDELIASGITEQEFNDISHRFIYLRQQFFNETSKDNGQCVETDQTFIDSIVNFFLGCDDSNAEEEGSGE